jgi:hypothetical protein
VSLGAFYDDQEAASDHICLRIMRCQIQVKGLDADGVMLISPTDPVFDSRLFSLLPEGAPVAFELKPCIAIVSNESSRIVVAYSVTFWFTFRSGESHRQSIQFKYPDAVANTATDQPDYGAAIDPGMALRARLRGREIRPGEQRVVGVGFELWPDADVVTHRDSYLALSGNAKDLTELKIELDAIVFADGLLLGPDHFGLSEQFAEYVAVKQDVYRRMVERIDGSSGVSDDIFASLRETASRHSGNTIEREAAAEALGLQHNIMRDVFQQALRREPFIIHRRM